MIQTARLRLTAWYAAIVIAILLVLGAATYFTMQRTLLDAIDRDLRLVVESVSPGALEDGERRSPSEDERRSQREHPDVFIVVVTATRRVVSSSSWSEADELVKHNVADAALAGRSGWQTISMEEDTFRTYSAPLRHDGRVTGAIISGRSLETHNRDLRLLLTVLGGSGLAGVALAVIGGYIFAGRSLQPIQEAYERQRRFVGDASHELRSPLAVIRASSDLLLRERLDAAQRESAEEIRDTAVEASALVDDLLALARLDHEAASTSSERSDLPAVAADIVRQMAPLLGAHGTVPTTHLDPATAGCPDPVIRRVLRALIENVIAHTPPGTAVTIDTGTEGGRAVLRVRDHGPGVPAAKLGTLFDRFTRVDTARTPGTGSGLGLAIVDSLVRRHRGEVIARNAVAGGLEVEVRLPLA